MVQQHPIGIATTAPAADPAPYRWTREHFYQMADLGWFAGQRVELLEGEIMVQSPQKWPHYSTIDRCGEVLRIAFGTGFWVRQQAPITFGVHSEPEPDVSVVAGSREDYSDHPTTALLLVEVSETTLAYDRGDKASLYALARIADYWIVNLVDRQVEVHRNPVADGTQPHGFGYADVQVLTVGDHISPLAAPHLQISIASLLG